MYLRISHVKNTPNAMKKAARIAVFLFQLPLIAVALIVLHYDGKGKHSTDYIDTNKGA